MGIPVPWGVCWSSEARYEIRNCRWADMRRAMWSPHSPGIGVPIFSKPHMTRQRMAVRNMLCSHCGKNTEKGKRYWFELGRITDGYYMTVDTPMHKHCAELSMLHCPRLKEMQQQPVLWPESASVIVSLIGGQAVAGDFGVNVTPESPVVGHLKFGWPMSRVKFNSPKAEAMAWETYTTRPDGRAHQPT